MALRITTHNDRESIIINDRKQLEAVLEVASDEAKELNLLSAVYLYAENGNFMTMVVGGKETVLGFDYGHLDPPYYASEGESDDDEPILTCFLTMKHHTEFPRKRVIPYADGMKAAAEFFESGNLPTCIKWEET